MNGEDHELVRNTGRAITCTWCVLFLLLTTLFSYLRVTSEQAPPATYALHAGASSAGQAVGGKFEWLPPDTLLIPNNEHGQLIRYGRNLISHTAQFLGPSGKVSRSTNGMNCQNCHLDAGTRYLGNNYSAVASTYPKFRARSGMIETVEKRVNDCIERSLNGDRLDEDSRELKAIVAYIKWVGKDVPPTVVPEGAGLYQLKYLDRPADPVKGKIVFEVQCVRCHGSNGGGIRTPDGREWLYPPLWGEESFNIAAGLYRLSRMAGYLKTNMPFEVATAENPVLSDEEAWDVAAYINSLPRPGMDISMDWPDISKKPIDHPFGPYADSFSQEQHKFGPFGPIKAAANRN